MESGQSGSSFQFQKDRDCSKSVGRGHSIVACTRSGGFDGVFEAAVKGRVDSIFVSSDGIINSHRKEVVNRIAKNRLPAMYTEPEWAEAGGLMVYGPSNTDLYRRAATYVDKILKGIKPPELPIEQPTQFELVINLKTAKQIGLAIPPDVLARADKVIK